MSASGCRRAGGWRGSYSDCIRTSSQLGPPLRHCAIVGKGCAGAELSRRDPVGYDVLMFHKLIAIVAWALLAFIAYATISPIQYRPTLPISSSFEHIAAFAVLGALFCLAYPRHIALVCLIVLGSALVLEFVQLLTPYRHGRIPDAVEKIAGGASGIVAGREVLHLERAKCWFQI
jgi:VanZ family protein